MLALPHFQTRYYLLPFHISLFTAWCLMEPHQEKMVTPLTKWEDTESQQKGVLKNCRYESQWYIYSPEWHVCLSFILFIPHQSRKYFGGWINEGSLGAPAILIPALWVKWITLAYYKDINTTLISILPSAFMWVFASFCVFVLGFPPFSAKHASDANYHRVITYQQTVQINTDIVWEALLVVTFLSECLIFNWHLKRTLKRFKIKYLILLCA